MNAKSFNLNALVKFLGRDDWALQFEEVMGDHFWPIMEEFGLDHEEIFELLGSHWAMTLWGCAFEDFLTQAFEPDGRTFVDIYLKSRGFKETARSKAYLKAISASVISLYETSDIVPGKSFLARDLLRGVDPVAVSEGTATQTLRQWEKIAVRIVHVGGTNVITGGPLPYSPEATEALFEGLKEMTGKKRPRKTLILDDDTLRLAAPLFTHAWLFDTLPRVLGEVQPLVCNSDGDDIVFHEVVSPSKPASSTKTSPIASPEWTTCARKIHGSGTGSVARRPRETAGPVTPSTRFRVQWTCSRAEGTTGGGMLSTKCSGLPT